MNIEANKAGGLEGVIAAVTNLSEVDGVRGELIVAGERIGDLAAHTGYEGLAARLWSIARGRAIGEPETRRWLGQARLDAFERMEAVWPALDGLSMAEAFRAGVAAVGLPANDPAPPEARIAGALAVLAAGLARRGAGQAPIAPDATLGQAQDILRMMRGARPGAAERAALDAYLVTVADHGMNASTFTARVVASTQADLGMVTTAAFCALSGPLHGGAPGPVMDMLDEIGAEERIAGWIDAALARGDRLMGFGHRIYRSRDPRADVLKGAIERLGASGLDLGFAAKVEAYARQALARAKPGRGLDTNAEFHTAILLDALKIPRDAFTLVFAVARCLGWTAHAIEQQRGGRLMRPASEYRGARPT